MGSNKQVSLAQAKENLSKLTELARQGETIVITKHGKPVAQIAKPPQKKKPIDLQALRKLTDSCGKQPRPAGKLMRQLRDDTRY